MSKDIDEHSGDLGTPEGASEAFQRLIEERYIEWEREFGDAVHVRRTVSFTPKESHPEG